MYHQPHLALTEGPRSDMSKKQIDWRERIDRLVADAPPLTEWQLEVLRRMMGRPCGPFKGLAGKEGRAA